MKTILLLRHSEPDKNSTQPNESIPLSECGKVKAKDFLHRLIGYNITVVYSSPYLRAKETASFLRTPILDERLIERQLGDKNTLNQEFWAKQYEDINFKNKDGESFLEVQQRMDACVTDILQTMNDGETAVVVSHAAAICSYLLQTCRITVVDPQQKVRKITYKDREIFCGKIKTPSAFCLTFDCNELTAVSYLE